MPKNRQYQKLSDLQEQYWKNNAIAKQSKTDRLNKESKSNGKSKTS